MPTKTDVAGSYLIHCPHCTKPVTVPVYVALGTPTAGDDATARQRPAKSEAWRQAMSEDEGVLLAEMERNGTVAAYAAAYEKQSGARPVDPARSMWGWFTRATDARLPTWAHKFYRTHYRAGNLATQVFNGVVAIFADGELREFVPVKLLRGEKVTALGRGEASMMKAATHADTEAWTRTKFGYVANNGAFAAMLRRRSVGDFADVR